VERTVTALANGEVPAKLKKLPLSKELNCNLNGGKSGMTEAATSSILGQFVDHGVDVNGLIIPGRSIENVLARHALNLVIKNDDETFKISLVGSATAVRYRGREILLTTQHQIHGIDGSQVSMLTDSGSHIITTGGHRSYSPRTDTDAYDIVAFDFSEPCKARPELKKYFFELNGCPPNVLHIHIVAVLLSGFPSDKQTYEIHENNHLGLARRQIVCLPDCGQPSDEALLAVRVLRPKDEDPDGMSGGSAFVIQLHNGRPQAYFAGIICPSSDNLRQKAA
jgi:hypothetical protein